MSEADDYSEPKPESPYAKFRQKPPARHQFKPKQSGNPLGRRVSKPKADEIDVEAALNKPMSVTQNRKTVKMTAFEVGLRGKVVSALIDHKIQAALDVVKLFLEHQVIKVPEGASSDGLIFLPEGWDKDEYIAKYLEFGPPPWPGQRHGLTEKQVEWWRKEKATPKKRGRPIGSRNRKFVTDRKVILQTVAYERHTIPGQRRKKTTIDLLLDMIRQAAARGHSRSHKMVDRLLNLFAVKEQRMEHGFLILPLWEGTKEEKDARLAERQRKYREG